MFYPFGEILQLIFGNTSFARNTGHLNILKSRYSVDPLAHLFHPVSSMYPPSIMFTNTKGTSSEEKWRRQISESFQEQRYHIFFWYICSREITEEKNDNVLISRKQDTIAFIIMSKDFQRTELSIIVSNKPTLCSPLAQFAYKKGMSSPVSKKVLNPNNGLRGSATFGYFFLLLNLDAWNLECVCKIEK